MILLPSFEAELKLKIESLLTNIEKHVCFIKDGQDKKRLIDEITTKLRANTPEVFIIAGQGPASLIVQEIVLELEEKENGYFIEKYFRKGRSILICNRLVLF